MPTSTRFRVLGAAAAAIGAFALPSTALAASLPKPDDPTIVPVESIGGVVVGQSVSDAEAAWGDVGKCKTQQSQRSCNYGSIKKGSATILADDLGVRVVEIMAPVKNGEFKFSGPLMDFRTSQGNLGLGSKLTKVAKKFPEAEVIEKRSVTIEGDGVEMLFFSSDKKHVTQVIARDTEIN